MSEQYEKKGIPWMAVLGICVVAGWICVLVVTFLALMETQPRSAAVAYCAEQNKLAQKSESAGVWVCVELKEGVTLVPEEVIR